MTYGIIDSGLGGYRNYLALHKAYPKAAFTFLADQKNAPYGNKSKDELLVIARKNMNFFLSQNIHQVIIACNTMNSLILDELKDEFKTIHFHELVKPTIEALKNSNHQSFCVLATQATTNSGIYKKGLEELLPNAKVDGIALPKLVNYIENMEDEELIKAYLHECIPQSNYDAMLLGCTHYPLITHIIEKEFNVKVYDSEQALVDSLKSEPFDEGPSRCLTTGDAQKAIEQAKTLFSLDEAFEMVVF